MGSVVRSAIEPEAPLEPITELLGRGRSRRWRMGGRDVRSACPGRAVRPEPSSSHALRCALRTVATTLDSAGNATSSIRGGRVDAGSVRQCKRLP